MIEVEITCSLSPLGLLKLQEKLRAMIHQGVTQQRDVYYDTTTWDFLRQAVFVRVRNNNKLQIKFDEEGSDKKHIDPDHLLGLVAFVRLS